jgi:hypothetical protein
LYMMYPLPLLSSMVCFVGYSHFSSKFQKAIKRSEKVLSSDKQLKGTASVTTVEGLKPTMQNLQGTVASAGLIVLLSTHAGFAFTFVTRKKYLSKKASAIMRTSEI